MKCISPPNSRVLCSVMVVLAGRRRSHLKLPSDHPPLDQDHDAITNDAARFTPREPLSRMSSALIEVEKSGQKNAPPRIFNRQNPVLSRIKAMLSLALLRPPAVRSAAGSAAGCSPWLGRCLEMAVSCCLRLRCAGIGDLVGFSWLTFDQLLH